MSPFEAALKGAGQIGFTIISITFSLIAVFIPLLFMGGIIGRLFREFAVVVTGGGARLGIHLADPDPGHVLAVPERPQRAAAGCAEPRRRALFPGGARHSMIAACPSCCGTSS